MKKIIVSGIAPFLIAAAPAPVTIIVKDVDEANLRAIIAKLVSFGTRHTLSSQTDPQRGIGAALGWVESEFQRYSKACGDCLAIAKPEDTVTGRRVPSPTRVVDVLAIQRGSSDPDRVIIISGHIDSRVSDVMDANSDAPGANDDGSGTATVIEAARVLSRYRFPATIVYAVLSGEEQGLLGGKILADYVRAQGWQVEAVLNNDIVGNSCSSDGKCDADHVRIFSEGPRWQGGEALRAPQRSLGGENDSPSRNLSRYIDTLAERLNIGLDARQIWRNDRFGRGGDHTEMLNAGYPAIRFSVGIENYNWQHQDLRVENGIEYGDTPDKMDFPYLARIVKLNVAALTSLARAPMPPEATVEGAVSTDTTIKWKQVSGAQRYRIRWRPTDAANWEESKDYTASVSEAVLEGVRVDDWIFGVSSLAADGMESPVASAVPGGAFKPYAPPPAEPQ